MPTGAKCGPWRETRKEALQDAVAADLGWTDDAAPAGVQLDQFVEIESAHILTEWELWACANEQIRQHGEDAATRSAMRADELEQGGDLDGARNWRLIVHRVQELLGPSGGRPH